MSGAVDGQKPLLADVSVDLSRRQAGVTQEFLDDPQVRTPVEQVRGEGVTQGVRVRRSRRPAVDDPPDVPCPQAPAPPVQKDGLRRGLRPRRASLSGRRATLEIESAQRSCIGTLRCLFPLPTTVTVRSTQVNIADIEAAQFSDPEPTPVEQLEHGMVADRHRGGELTRPSAPTRSGGRIENRRHLRTFEHPRQAGTTGRGTEAPRRVRPRARPTGTAKRSSNATPPPCGRSTPSRNAWWRGTRGSAAGEPCRLESGVDVPPRRAHSTKPATSVT